jgi:hypothetical protein
MNEKQAKRHLRAKPGSRGSGHFFHIQVRPKAEFEFFRNQDVGGKGGLERVAGRRPNGTWATQKWLIGKEHAHLAGARLVPDTPEARKLFRLLGSPPKHLGGDRFKAKDRPNVPESLKPTPAMRKAQMRNVRIAQATKRTRQRSL